MGWRNHATHREETVAVKKALKQQGIAFSHVGHGQGTAWAWLEIHLPSVPADMEHIPHTNGYAYSDNCPACVTNRAIRDRAIEIIRAVTGRRGDYGGEISVEY